MIDAGAPNPGYTQSNARWWQQPADHNWKENVSILNALPEGWVGLLGPPTLDLSDSLSLFGDWLVFATLDSLALSLKRLHRSRHDPDADASEAS